MFCHRTEQEKQWKGEKKYWLKRPQPCAADMLHTIGPVAIFSEVGNALTGASMLKQHATAFGSYSRQHINHESEWL